MTGTLQQINALAHRWHRDMEQLGNGRNGSSRLKRDVEEIDAELEKLCDQQCQTLAIEHGRSIPQWMLDRPHTGEGYFNEPLHVYQVR